MLDRLALGDSITKIVEAYEGRVPTEAASEAIDLANRLFVSAYAPEMATAR